MLSFPALRSQICELGRLLYQRGYVVGHDGNISVRTAPDRLLITPSGVGKGRMELEQLVLCDLDGQVLEGRRHPSSELLLHLEVYRQCPEVNAVVHAHPPVSTAFAVCGRALDVPYLTEMVSGLGDVPVAPYALPSTSEVADSVRPLIGGRRALLLANHGSLAWGKDLLDAFDCLESVEHTAQICALADLLGGGRALDPQQVAALQALSGKYSRLAQPLSSI